MVMAPLRVPNPVGEKVTLITQLAVTASERGHRSLSAKSPEATMLVIDSARLPRLESVKVCAALVVPKTCWLNVKPKGDTLTIAAAPVPLNVTLWKPLPALSKISTFPEVGPLLVGVKVTLIVQLAFAARARGSTGQVLVSAKAAELVEMLEKVSGASPILVNVNVWAALVVPKFWLANVKTKGDRLTTGTWMFAILATKASEVPP